MNQVVVGPAFSNPLLVTFGPVPGAGTDDATVVVRSFHDATRTLVNIGVGGEAASDFSITGGSCSVGTELPCTIELRFAPVSSVRGTREAVLSVDVDPGSGRSARLRGVVGLEALGPTETVTPDVSPVVTS